MSFHHAYKASLEQVRFKCLVCNNREFQGTRDPITGKLSCPGLRNHILQNRVNGKPVCRDHYSSLQASSITSNHSMAYDIASSLIHPKHATTTKRTLQNYPPEHSPKRQCIPDPSSNTNHSTNAHNITPNNQEATTKETTGKSNPNIGSHNETYDMLLPKSFTLPTFSKFVKCDSAYKAPPVCPISALTKWHSHPRSYSLTWIWRH